MTLASEDMPARDSLGGIVKALTLVGPAVGDAVGSSVGACQTRTPRDDSGLKERQT
jgi:hypothetical protein